MSEYKIEDVKRFFDEARKKINDGISKGNDYWRENENEHGYIPNYAKDNARRIWDETRKQAWDGCFTKLEEAYPGCLSDKNFANLFVRNGFQLTGYTGQYARSFYDRFSGDGQIGLIESFDLYDYEDMFPETVEKLDKDILGKLSSSDYAKLELQDYGEETEEPSFLEMRTASKVVEGKKGNIIEEGILISKCWPEVWDEVMEQYQDEYSREGVFIPFNDFSKAEVWNKSESELSEAFMAIAETVRHLPYKNMLGLLKQMELLPKNTSKENLDNIHDISEISDTVSDRKLEDINKVVAEISEEMKDKSKEDEQTKGN